MKKKPRRTIKDWIDYRHPTFDSSKQQILLNDVPIDPKEIDKPLGPLDAISVVGKHHR